MNNLIEVHFAKNTGKFDYEAYRQRMQGRYVAEKRRKDILAAAECISTVLLGMACLGCIVIVASVF